MKKLLIIAVLFVGCNQVQQKPLTDLNTQVDSLKLSVNALLHNIHVNDSVKNVLLKQTFAAGCRSGISIGINHCSESIESLQVRATVDSFNFSKIVDESFKYKP